jgi:hypothetical protein
LKRVTIKGKSPAPEKVRSTRNPSGEVLLGKGGVTEMGWHKIASFLRCPKSYQYEIIRQITKPQVQVPTHFAKGTLHHAMRARWFSLKFATDEKAWASVLQAAEEAAEEERLPIDPKDMQASVALFSAYIEHWSRRPLPTPIAAEYKVGPVAILPGSDMKRTARLDDASFYPEAEGRLCLGESKTTSGSPNDVVREYELHGQPTLQMILWRMSKRGEAKYGPAAGVMLDIAKKPERGDRPAFARVFVRIEPRVLDWYARSMVGYLKAASMVDWDTEVPRNITGCTFMAGRARIDCMYKDLCRYGADVTAKYIMQDGSSLKRHVPEPGKEKMPWE